MNGQKTIPAESSTEIVAHIVRGSAGLAHVRIERLSAETSEASAAPSRPAAPASDETSSYAICSDGADRLEPLRSDPVGDRAAPLSGDALGCENFRSRLLRFVESTNDPAPVVAALREVGSSGVERADSIPVRGLTDILCRSRAGCGRIG